MKRRSKSNTIPRDLRENTPASVPSFFNLTTIAIMGAIFAIGIGIGIAFSSTATFDPGNVASREVIDRSAPNTELCVQFGASAMVADLRVFLTLNPFNVFVTQPTLRPGCVLRQNNWSILEQRKAVTSEQVRDCKQRMNTFGFTGTLESNPQINCIYQNNNVGNLFLNQGGVSGGRSDTENF
jgi:hypothetical protein